MAGQYHQVAIQGIFAVENRVVTWRKQGIPYFLPGIEPGNSLEEC